jgi:hypothetical protein
MMRDGVENKKIGQSTSQHVQKRPNFFVLRVGWQGWGCCEICGRPWQTHYLFFWGEGVLIVSCS